MKQLFFFISFFIVSGLYAQNDSNAFQLKVNVDIASRYIWRGSDYFNSPCIQPDMELVYKDKIGIGAWGSFCFASQPIQENDLFIFTNLGNFSVYIYDYFYMNQTDTNYYFNYKDKETGHTLSCDISYKISEDLPLNILLSYNFYGNDTLHSTYLELSYTMKKKPVSFFAGATFDKGWYGDEAGVVNTGIQFSKEIKITEHYSLPVDVRCIVNPQRENIFLTAIIHL